MRKPIRDRLGIIPDDHFENKPSGPAKNVSPMSQAMKDHIEKVKAFLKRKEQDDTDKYNPDDEVNGY
jgi:hypothetical protein